MNPNLEAVENSVDIRDMKRESSVEDFAEDLDNNWSL